MIYQLAFPTLEHLACWTITIIQILTWHSAKAKSAFDRQPHVFTSSFPSVKNKLTNLAFIRGKQLRQR
jgi:hypothetical protein